MNAFGERNISVKGMDELVLSEEQVRMLNRKVIDKYDRIERSARKIDEFVLHVKGYHGEGKRKKYSLSLKVSLGKNVLSVKASDWGIITTLEKGLENLERKLKKDYRVLASTEEQVK